MRSIGTEKEGGELERREDTRLGFTTDHRRLENTGMESNNKANGQRTWQGIITDWAAVW